MGAEERDPRNLSGWPQTTLVLYLDQLMYIFKRILLLKLSLMLKYLKESA